jgi:hypothetical protein
MDTSARACPGHIAFEVTIRQGLGHVQWIAHPRRLGYLLRCVDVSVCAADGEPSRHCSGTYWRLRSTVRPIVGLARDRN